MPSRVVIGVLIDMHSSVWCETILTRWDPARIDLFQQAFVVAELSHEPVVDKLGGKHFGAAPRYS
jgi:hypothetical protein